MPRHTSACRFISYFITIVALSLPANALTGEEVMTNMSDRESFAYIAGSVEMAAFMASADGQSARAQCIIGTLATEMA